MRYYVVLHEDDEPPAIVAETVRDRSDNGTDRTLSLAGGIGGPAASILTESELAAQRGGRDALDAWRAGDDSAYDGVTVILEAAEDDPDLGPHLRLVVPLREAPRRRSG